MFKLVIQDDEGKTTVVPLIRDEITIGRKEGNTIRLTERNVSRRHARILRNNGEVQIEDLGSYNGIRVNNARIAERVSLRVSDQVQIGDYKLYLKAEGVEQVDDARTMPIERLDSATATEVMPAMTPAAAANVPTQPMSAAAAQAAAAASAPTAPRAAVGTADTDPAGRPVATAAQVAALTQPTGYGKLVVISSNYAGKEFDLTRPQMIIGRTDENDLVLNHRSISRNHAKITRDTETGRYTISDLQSSNGVRVNGQDYGKVELRRGDVIDLGHVRLRFVEPGEDFVFARDAVIADVVEPGGKKGMMMFVAIALVLALGGAAVYFLVLKKGDKPGPLKGDNGSALVVGPGSNLVASGSDTGTGPGSAVVAVATPDAGDEATPPPDDEKGRITTECIGYKAEKKWADLNGCADKLVIFDKEAAKQMRATAKAELQNESSLARIKEFVNDKALVKARKELESIEKDSVYRKDADDAVSGLEQKMTDDARDTAAKYAKTDCAKLDSFIRQERAQGIELKNIKCEVVVAQHPTGGNPTGGNPTGGNPTGGNPTGGGSATPTAACDPEDLKAQGRDLEAKGAHAAALNKFKDSLKCKNDPTTRALAFMAACNGTNITEAKALYKKLPPDAQNQYAQMCIRRGITKEQLDAP